MPTVSIGLPVYNGEVYLAESIRSILDQTYQNFELIISDNASTDRTEEICRQFMKEDNRIVYLRSAENLGAAFNYNKTFHVSTGKYFKWAAHDDIILPKFLERCVATFEQCDSPPAIVHPASEIIDAQGVVVGRHPDKIRCLSNQPAIRIFSALQGPGLMASIFGLFHRDTLARSRLIGSFIASDYVLIMEMATLGKIIYLEGEPLFRRRVHEKMSRQAHKSKSDVLRWFDPKASTSRLNPKTRMRLEYFRSLRTLPGLSPSQRLACATAVVGGIATRSSRVTLGRWRRQIAGIAVPHA